MTTASKNPVSFSGSRSDAANVHPKNTGTTVIFGTAVDRIRRKYTTGKVTTMSIATATASISELATK